MRPLMRKMSTVDISAGRRLVAESGVLSSRASNHPRYSRERWRRFLERNRMRTRARRQPDSPAVALGAAGRSVEPGAGRTRSAELLSGWLLMCISVLGSGPSAKLNKFARADYCMSPGFGIDRILR